MSVKKYPHYRFELKWIFTREVGKDCWCKSDPDDTKDKPCRSCGGLPDGQSRNGTGWNTIFREEPTPEELQKFCEEAFQRQVDKDNGAIEGTMTYEVKKLEDTTWCLSWFEHWTFDEGQTDQEVLESFEQHVRHWEEHNDEFPEFDKNHHCLMGAEDRWRWHGAAPDGKPDDRSDPPCRCSFCKEQGIIRIAH